MYISIPTKLIALLTFPGVIIREVFHKFFCDLLGVPVRKVCYFRYDNPSSYLIHEPVEHLSHALLIVIGPFFACTILAMILSFVPNLLSYKLSLSPSSLDISLLWWIGLSIGMNSLPTNQAVFQFSDTLQGYSPKSPIYIIAKIFSTLLNFLILLKSLWIDLFYAIFITEILTGSLSQITEILTG